MGQLTSVAAGHIPQVRDRHLPTGFLQRLIHNDVNATFRCLQQVAKATEEALAGLSQSKNLLLEAHNATVDVVDNHRNRIQVLENLRNGDVAASNQTARVVDGHSNRIDALCLETNGLRERVRQLEMTRERDRQAAEQTVAIIDQHSHQMSVALQQIETLRQAKENTDTRFTDICMNSLEMAENIRTLFASREDLTAMVIDSERRMDQMAQTIQQLAAAVALLTNRPTS